MEMAFRGEKWETFLGGKGGKAPDPLTRSRQRNGAVTRLQHHRNGYVNSVQPPFQKFLDPPMHSTTFSWWRVSWWRNSLVARWPDTATSLSASLSESFSCSKERLSINKHLSSRPLISRSFFVINDNNFSYLSLYLWSSASTARSSWLWWFSRESKPVLR